ncbi:MAG: hypothetical protein CM1200mP20_16490 [Pseudomonadota bacterium]|nr:MAG: hypothetical protein CM1200mP20_16490 [Pseudomonadota bacterium]
MVEMLADERGLYVASRALKAMGHPLRLKILCILAGASEISVQDLVERVGTFPRATSHSIFRFCGTRASSTHARTRTRFSIG